MLSGTRTRALLLLSAGVTVAMLVLQVAMVNVMTVAYAAGPKASVAAAVEQMLPKRVRVFEPMLRAPPAALPVVLMHGMGDAAGNTGMLHIRDVRTSAVYGYRVVMPTVYHGSNRFVLVLNTNRSWLPSS